MVNPVSIRIFGESNIQKGTWSIQYPILGQSSIHKKLGQSSFYKVLGQSSNLERTKKLLSSYVGTQRLLSPKVSKGKRKDVWLLSIIPFH